MFKIQQKRVQGAKKFTIIPDTVKFDATGQHTLPIPGIEVVLSGVSYVAHITEAENDACKQKCGMSIIEKLKTTDDYKGGYLEITKVPDDEAKKTEEVKETKEIKGMLKS